MIALATLGVIASVLLPLIPVWPFVLFEHFRFQYLWVGTVVVPACAALRLWIWTDLALIATLVNALHVLPDLAREAPPLPAHGKPLRVLVLNVHTSSTAYGDVSRLIADTQPDVVGLVEVDDRWLAELTPSLAGYPQRITAPRGDNFGVALFTALPMTGSAEHIGSDMPTIIATVDVGGTPLGIVLTHPIPPVAAAPYEWQVAQLDAIAGRARASSPIIVMGDFNATPWSRPFRDFLATTGLNDTRAGFGLQATFPASSKLLRIPIDHVLVSSSIGVRSRRVERDVGSDHLPVLVDLVIP